MCAQTKQAQSDKENAELRNNVASLKVCVRLHCPVLDFNRASEPDACLQVGSRVDELAAKLKANTDLLEERGT